MAEENLKRPEETPEDRYTELEWSGWTRRVVTICLLILGVYALTLLRPVLQILVMALVLAFLLFSPARVLTRRLKMPYPLAVLLLYLLLIILLLLSLVIFAPAGANVIEQVALSIDQAYEDVYDQLGRYQPGEGKISILGIEIDLEPLILPVKDFAAELPRSLLPDPTDLPPATPLPEPSGDAPPTATPVQLDFGVILQSIQNIGPILTGTITSTVALVLGLLLQAFMVMFLSFLILLEIPAAFTWFVSLLPQEGRREYGLLLDRMIDVWNEFFISEVTIGLIIGFLTWLQLIIMGIPSALGLAVFTGFISLIPTLGGVIALIPLFLIPAFQGSSVILGMSNVSLALLVTVINLVMQQIIWNGVAPKILGDAMSIPLPVIIIGLIIGSAFGGLLGAFLVVPILGTIRVILLYVFRKLHNQDPYPGEPTPAILQQGLFAPLATIHNRPQIKLRRKDS